MAQLIPFVELTGGTEAVRITVIKGKTYMSITDIIVIVRKQTNTGAQDTKDAQRKARKDACDVWQDIPDRIKAEVKECTQHFKFPGQGQHIQEVITLKGALKLVNWIPGDTAKEYRDSVTEILMRYLAGDASMHGELEANAASTSPINVLAREEVGSKRIRDEDDQQLHLVRQTRKELDEMVQVSDTFGVKLAQQKADAIFVLEAVEKITGAQLKAAEAQIKAAEAQQKTFAADLQTTQAKAGIEIDLMEKKNKFSSAERNDELLFLQKKQKLLAQAQPLQSTQEQEPVPQVHAPGLPPQPKTVRDIAQEEDYWHDLPTHMRDELVTRAGVNARKEHLVPMPDKVDQISSHGTIWKVYTYDINNHSAVRGILRRAYTDMIKKVPASRLRKATNTTRQRGINDLPGFTITVTPRTE
jgi:hypothetical protein